ncbi:UPF0481 protein At3g47200-like [Corylus avellana]|uniref:UPF0481 protein At3g47200-like n=1 Tax=Corylus avellana TaxID=13451 RepID=UPI001E23D823|nr:UPF0481 protein At3g47200-like [Corylus avellana]
MASNNHASSDIENPQQVPLQDSIAGELESLSCISSACSIYRVPERLRHVKERAYTPKVVSIGPLHHGRKGLKAMEEQKKWYLRDFIRRSNPSLGSFIRVVKEKEERLRGCYAERIQFSSDEFVKIILVDAAFIIGVLLRLKFPNDLQDENDCIFNRPWMLQDVWPDMLLLENQLPFFILENLFEHGNVKVSSHGLSIYELSHNFFKDLMHLEETEDKLKTIISSSKKVEHFVDFLRHLHLPDLQQQQKQKGKLQTLTTPSMMELHLAGVGFEVGSSRNLFDLQFNKAKGILKIPKLIICDETEVSVRNLLAFEQCYYRENYINDYVVIMDRLVNSQKDVDLLVEYGIFENRLGDSSEGSFLINKLADGVILDFTEFYFATLCEDLNTYCRASWHKWKANLRQNYFNTPWAIVSVIAGVILLLLTLTQAVCALISLPSPNSDGKQH